MLVYVQYALGTPQDWEAYPLTTAKDIRDLPKEAEPPSLTKRTTTHHVGHLA